MPAPAAHRKCTIELSEFLQGLVEAHGSEIMTNDGDLPHVEVQVPDAHPGQQDARQIAPECF